MDNWRDGLSDDVKGNESLAVFEDVEGLAKSFIETKAMVGRGIQIPSEDAGEEANASFITNILEKAPGLMLKPDFENPEQSTEFFRTLGTPDDSAGYEQVKYEEMSFPEDREKALREMSFGAKLTKTQHKALSENMLKFDHDAKVAGESAMSEAMQGLRGEWGMAFDDRKALANKVRLTFLDFIPEGAMDAATTQALYNIGAQLGSEGTSLGDNRNEGGEDGRMTPADALSRIDDIMQNKEHPYWISMHPGHDAALKKMIELRTAADPDAGTTLPRAGFGS
jgi:hypothetical protein